MLGFQGAEMATPTDKHSFGRPPTRVVVAAEMNFMALDITGLHGFTRESSPLLAVHCITGLSTPYALAASENCSGATQVTRSS
ncbi:jg17598, partial [Pararge aegeria aegeria]